MQVRCPVRNLCDYGSQFISDKIKHVCDEWNIMLLTSTPIYPQANGQAESSNKMVIDTLKKRLTAKKKGKWAKSVPVILWVNHTTLRITIGQTPS